MWRNGSNAHKSAITAALIAARATTVAILITAAAVLPSGGSSNGTNLAAVASSSERITSLHSPSPTPVPSTSGSASSNESPACAKGSLTLVGSTAFRQIAQDAADAYTRDCPPGVTITVDPGGSAYSGDSAYGLSQLQHTRSSTAGSIIAMYDGTSANAKEFEAFSMGFVIFSVVAYAGLFPGSNIAPDELVTIFVRHGDQGVVAVGRRAGSGSRKAFIMTVLGMNPGPPDKGSCPTPTGNAVSFGSCTAGSTQDLLAFVNGTPNAIGYAETYGPFPGYRHVSVLSIDGVMPNIPNVRSGLYKFWAVEHLYAIVNPAPLTKDFLAFLSNYYIKSHPFPDFIACSDAPQILEAYCQSSPGPTSSSSPGPTSATSPGPTSATSPGPTSATSQHRRSLPLDILIWAAAVLVILLAIWVLIRMIIWIVDTIRRR